MLIDGQVENRTALLHMPADTGVTKTSESFSNKVICRPMNYILWRNKKKISHLTIKSRSTWSSDSFYNVLVQHNLTKA